MLNSTFCIVPMGTGWGIRMPETMLSGCIPIITQDHVYMVSSARKGRGQKRERLHSACLACAGAAYLLSLLPMQPHAPCSLPGQI